MVSKCANPACSASFRYLRSGKLFEFEVSDHSSNGRAATPMAAARKSSRHVEYFWLCGQCASEMTLVKARDGGVVFVPVLKPAVKTAAAAS